MITRRPWREELEIVDRTMKAISGVTDPEELVEKYWQGIGDLLPFDDYVAVSRRNEKAPEYVITRSSRFTEYFNPWTERHHLPKFSGGLLGEVAYANAPVIIDDLPSRLSPDDPAYFYLQGFGSLIAAPQYDGGEGLNVTAMLIPPGVEFDHSIIPMIHWQTGLFGRGTQNLVLRNQLAKALELLDKELHQVGEIQRSLLPPAVPIIEGLDVAVHYQASARASGDYYDFFEFADGNMGFVIADVSGHGTPAAVLMAIMRALVHSRPEVHQCPSGLLNSLNRELTRHYTRNGTFITAFCGVVDRATRTLTYSSAGHNPPRLIRNGQVFPLEQGRSLPMGILESEEYTEASIDLCDADLLLVYTDGIVEAAPLGPRNAPREMFSVDRLDQTLLDCATRPAAECIDRIRTEVAAFCSDAPPADDQTLIAMRCR